MWEQLGTKLCPWDEFLLMASYAVPLKYLLHRAYSNKMILEISVKQICVQGLSKAGPHLFLQLLNKLRSRSSEIPF